MDRAIGTLTAGFITDPFNRWLYPVAQDYFAIFPDFARCFVEPGCEDGTVFAEKTFGIVSAWMRPGVSASPEPVERAIQETVRTEIQADVWAALERMETYHHKAGACWYLPLIAADPSRQNQGLGSAMMKHSLEKASSEGLSAYLESANPKNVPFYQRHGFEIMGEIQVGDSPVIRPMVRPAG